MHRDSYTMAFSQHIKDVYKTETAQQNQEETAGQYDENQRRVTTIYFFFKTFLMHSSSVTMCDNVLVSFLSYFIYAVLFWLSIYIMSSALRLKT